MSPTHSKRKRARCLFTAAVLAITGSQRIASAQNEQQEGELVAEQRRVAEFSAQTERLFLMRHGIEGLKPRELLEALLQGRLDRLAADDHLTQAQVKKLELAGRGDIKRFMDQLDQFARDFGSARNNRNQLQAIKARASDSFRVVDAGFFVRESLLFKVLTNIYKSKRSEEKVEGGAENTDGGTHDAISAEDRLRFEERRARAELIEVTRRVRFKEDFDRWITTELGSGVERRRHLEARLSNRVHELTADCNLSESQLKALRAAGEDDINRMLKQIEDLEKRFAKPSCYATEFPSNETESLKLSYLNEFGGGSSFSRTLATTISPEQLALHERGLGERNRLRYRRAIHETAATLATAVRMSEEQRTQVEQLIQNETRPPRRFGRFSQTDVVQFSDPDSAVVLVQAARISEAKWKAMASEELYDKLSRRLARWRDPFHEAWLKRHGFVFEDEGSVPRGARAETTHKNS